MGVKNRGLPQRLKECEKRPEKHEKTLAIVVEFYSITLYTFEKCK